MSSRPSGSVLVMLVCLVVTTSAADLTQQERAHGAVVVQTTCDVITAGCVFPEDKMFMRRMAMTESSDGDDLDTFRTGYYGGIWQVDELMFNMTQSQAARSYLQPSFTNITKVFSLNWLTVSWRDLTKPLHSALAARLYIHFQSRSVNSAIPRPITDQGQFWKTYYHPTADADKFVKDADRIQQGCSNSRGTDLIFLLDSSGSIGASNFAKVLQFVWDVINSTDVGLDKTRVGVISFSTSVRTEFNLNSYDNKTAMLNAVRRIVYMNSGTNTHLGLDQMRTVGFNSSSGARPLEEGYPHLAIVMTDGESNDHPKTLVAASRAKNASITMFAVGVGSSLNEVELTAIASEPTCQYLMHLANFDEIESLKYAIQKGACEAPIIVGSTESSTTKGSLTTGANQNCKLKISSEGATVKLASRGGSITFYISKLTYPNSAYFDRMVTSRPDKMGVMYIPYKTEWGDEGLVFCNIEAASENVRRRSTNQIEFELGLRIGDQDLCSRNTCKTGECIDLGTDFKCGGVSVSAATTAVVALATLCLHLLM